MTMVLDLLPGELVVEIVEWLYVLDPESIGALAQAWPAGQDVILLEVMKMLKNTDQTGLTFQSQQMLRSLGKFATRARFDDWLNNAPTLTIVRCADIVLSWLADGALRDDDTSFNLVRTAVLVHKGNDGVDNNLLQRALQGAIRIDSARLAKTLLADGVVEGIQALHAAVLAGNKNACEMIMRMEKSSDLLMRQACTMELEETVVYLANHPDVINHSALVMTMRQLGGVVDRIQPVVFGYAGQITHQNSQKRSLLLQRLHALLQASKIKHKEDFYDSMNVPWNFEKTSPNSSYASIPLDVQNVLKSEGIVSKPWFLENVNFACYTDYAEWVRRPRPATTAQHISLLDAARKGDLTVLHSLFSWDSAVFPKSVLVGGLQLATANAQTRCALFLSEQQHRINFCFFSNAMHNALAECVLKDPTCAVILANQYARVHLQMAAKLGKRQELVDLLEHHAALQNDIRTLDTVFDIALRQNNYDIVQCLLEQWRPSQVALGDAVYHCLLQNNEPMAAVLLAKLDPQERQNQLCRVLQRPMTRSSPGAIEFLLNNLSPPSVGERYGFVQVMEAAIKNADTAFVSMLINNVIVSEAILSSIPYLIEIACKQGDMCHPVFKLLLQRYPDAIQHYSSWRYDRHQRKWLRADSVDEYSTLIAAEIVAEYNRTWVLPQAAYDGDIETVEYLLTVKGMSINVHQDATVQGAIAGQHQELVLMLVKRFQANIQNPSARALRIAARNGDENMMRLLITINATLPSQNELDQRKLVRAAAAGGSLSILQYVLHLYPWTFSPTTLLPLACSSGNPVLVRWLLQAGALPSNICWLTVNVRDNNFITSQDASNSSSSSSIDPSAQIQESDLVTILTRRMYLLQLADSSSLVTSPITTPSWEGFNEIIDLLQQHQCPITALAPYMSLAVHHVSSQEPIPLILQQVFRTVFALFANIAGTVEHQAVPLTNELLLKYS